MRRNIPFVALFLIATPIFGQRATAFRSGPATSFRASGGRFEPTTIVSVPTVRNTRFSERGFNRPFGHSAGKYSPYLWVYPFFGDYGFAGSYTFGYLPPTEDRSPNSLIMDSNAPPTQPAKPAHAAIREYKWKETVGGGSDETATFTIALTDGSRRYSVAVWVQNGNLYYIDSQGRQQVLPSGAIDRDATQHLNKANNLNLQLPPS